MKPILALMLLAALGVLAAGCGSAKKTASGPITVAGTTTISDVQTGVTIRCKGGAGAAVPARGHGVVANADGRSSSAEIELQRRKDGSVLATCHHS